MPKYAILEQRELEQFAQAASTDHKSLATALITSILGRHGITYAVSGLMGIYLHGVIPQLAGPVEIALQADDFFVPDILNLFAANRKYVIDIFALVVAASHSTRPN